MTTFIFACRHLTLQQWQRQQQHVNLSFWLTIIQKENKKIGQKDVVFDCMPPSNDMYTMCSIAAYTLAYWCMNYYKCWMFRLMSAHRLDFFPHFRFIYDTHKSVFIWFAVRSFHSPALCTLFVIIFSSKQFTKVQQQRMKKSKWAMFWCVTVSHVKITCKSIVGTTTKKMSTRDKMEEWRERRGSWNCQRNK